MTPREQEVSERLLALEKIIPLEGNKTYGGNELCRLILEWADKYPAPAPVRKVSVTREQIEGIFNRYGAWQPDGGQAYRTPDCRSLIDDLLAFLPPGEKKVWCEHLEWVVGKAVPGWDRWEVKSRENADGTVTAAWALFDGKFCPICGKERPT